MIRVVNFIMKYSVFILMVLMLISFTFPYANAESVPDWVKNNAGWWATDAISEKEFVNAIEFLIKDGIIIVSDTKQNKSQ